MAAIRAPRRSSHVFNRANAHAEHSACETARSAIRLQDLREDLAAVSVLNSRLHDKFDPRAGARFHTPTHFIVNPPKSDAIKSMPDHLPITDDQYRPKTSPTKSNATENSPPLGGCSRDLLTCVGWTRFTHGENPAGRFGPDTASNCASSAQFRQNPVRDFSICASERFLQFRAADAPACG